MTPPPMARRVAVNTAAFTVTATQATVCVNTSNAVVKLGPAGRAVPDYTKVGATAHTTTADVSISKCAK
jgi:hypothetical protein